MHTQGPQRDALERAYHEAEYCIEDAGLCLTLRIGQPSAGLAAVLPAGAGAAFLTAWNPLGRQRADAENRAANEELAADARDLGAGVLRGCGRAPDGSWEEESFLLAGIGPDAAMELARRHRQLAWVWVPPEPRVPELRWTGLAADRDAGSAG